MIRQQLSIFDLDEPSKREVRRVPMEDAIPFILKIHYARRMPTITDAFGLYEGGGINRSSDIRHPSYSVDMRWNRRGRIQTQCKRTKQACHQTRL